VEIRRVELSWKAAAQKTEKEMEKRIQVVSMAGGWNWLRVVSSGGF
jgi:hypothetical protein